MDQPTNPYADPQITADAEAARARWERLAPEQRTAFLIEIGILTPDLQLAVTPSHTSGWHAHHASNMVRHPA